MGGIEAEEKGKKTERQDRRHERKGEKGREPEAFTGPNFKTWIHLWS